MFDKVMIANRGEIAIRVIRTCRELGIKTVAVYSDFDRNSAHVRMADEAIHLGGNLPAESYLDVGKVLDAAARTGAQAIHPGYGFLSENADFARAVTESGITWIGPPPEAIVQMGDKVSSRHAAIDAGFDPVPGTADPISSAAEVVTFGEERGWPVAIKAAYGGGGKGIRIAYDKQSAEEGFEASQREALAYFGNDDCYLERYLERPRHIEIQVLCDSHGNGVWLGERDCSVQRRHQKVIEETPSPAVDDDLRRRMGEDAVKVAKQVGYVNAGTVECLVQDGEYWFLEMNTRLQVEHCVTEEVTGMDLVEAQLRIASGEKLWFGQDDIERNGHSIECRINAEDASANFMPSPGLITSYTAPGGHNVRVDAGYGAGDEVSQFYDNMIGKLIVWGEDRAHARRVMLRALDEIHFGGIKTNVPLHKLILNDHDFVSGDISVKWLENSVDLSALEEPASPVAAEADEGAEPEEMVERSATVEVGSKRFDVKVYVPESQAAPVGTAGAGGPKPRKRRARGSGGVGAAAGGGDGTVTTPMQGTVLKVLVDVGQEIAAGDAVAVIEAMKMENNVNATTDGTVNEVKIAAGDSVAAGDVLVVIG